MSKKLIIPLVLLIWLVGCNYVQSSSTKEVNIPSVTKAKNHSYKIVGNTYHRGDISIEYPQIQQFQDNKKEQKLNTLLRKEALAVLQYSPNVNNDIHMDVRFNVVNQTNTLLSIQYDGYRSIDNSAYSTNIFHTTNLDINNTAILRLGDLFKNSTSLAEWLQSTNPNAINMDQPSFKQVIRLHELTQLLAHNDSLDTLQPEEEYPAFMYIHERKLGLSVPVIHALGDHAEYEMGLCDFPTDWRTLSVV